MFACLLCQSYHSTELRRCAHQPCTHQAFILRAQEHCCKYQTDSRELTDRCTAGKCNQDMTSALCPRAFFIDYTFKGGYVYMQCPPLEHCGTKKCWWWIDRCHHKMRTTERPQAVDRNLWWPPTPRMPSSEIKHAITCFPLKLLSFFCWHQIDKQLFGCGFMKYTQCSWVF